MSNCNNCIHKNDGCFCPLDKNCTAYKKEVHEVKYNFEFNAPDDWTPGEFACWAHCPFNCMIKLGDRCTYMKDKGFECPFKGHLTKTEAQVNDTVSFDGVTSVPDLRPINPPTEQVSTLFDLNGDKSYAFPFSPSGLSHDYWGP